MPQHDKSKPNIVARMQTHGSTFAYCIENTDVSGAMLMIQLLNKDLPKDDQIIVGHGVDKATIRSNDISNAKLIDESCNDCKKSLEKVDMHPPPDAIGGQDRLHIKSKQMEWLTAFSIFVEGKISEVGYKRGWFNE